MMGEPQELQPQAERIARQFAADTVEELLDFSGKLDAIVTGRGWPGEVGALDQIAHQLDR